MTQNERNPYVIGTPIELLDSLFGRNSIFEDIRDNLRKDAKFILLHGQRRIGKSSVLKIIPRVITEDNIVFVSYDFQVYQDVNIGKILCEIIKEILKLPQLDKRGLDDILKENLELTDIHRITRRIISDVCYQLNQQQLKLVLLLDEFDVVNQQGKQQAVELLRFLNTLIIREDELYLIAVVGRYFKSMPDIGQIFRNAPSLEIGLLDEDSATKLITQTAINTLQYKQITITEILKLSSRHPYYTQVLCSEVFNLARCEDVVNFSKFTVVPEDVIRVLPQAIDSAAGGLGGFWDGLNIYEKVVVSTIAQAQEQSQAIENPFQILEDYGLVLTEPLQEAIPLLIIKEILDSNPIKIKVEIMRLWLLERHQLRDEIANLETVEESNVKPLLDAAKLLWSQENTKTSALNQYEQVLHLNPNHFRIIVELAEKYLQVDANSYDKALPLYERAYKLDRSVYKYKFIEVLDQYGDYLQEQGNYIQAQEQYEKILRISSDNDFAREKIIKTLEKYGDYLQEQGNYIKAREQYENILRISPDNDFARNKLREMVSRNSPDDAKGIFQQSWELIRQPKLLKIFGITTVSLAIIGIIYVLLPRDKPCPAGQEKNQNRECVAEQIPTPNSTPNPNQESLSSGDRAFFPVESNISAEFQENRNKGINNFKQGQYQDAAKHFNDAVKNNRNDPEVLIYYNNALARQQKNPLVLAVAVPATHSSNYVLAQEILRGVAQAQQEFNINKGLNGRLLEIIIADDGDSPNKMSIVAQQLLKNTSLLGVIGHNASDVTTPVLPIYEKAKIPIVSSTSSSTKLNSPVFFRAIPSDKKTGEKLAEFSIRNSLKKISILCNPSSPYSSSIKEEFRVEFEKQGGQVIGNNGKINGSCINLTSDNADKEISNISKENIQAIAIFPDTKNLEISIDIAKKYKAKISGIKLLGAGSVYTNQTLKRGGNDIEGLVVAVPWFHETPKAQAFVQKAKEQWGNNLISWRTATSYDALKCFLAAIQLSSYPSKEAVLENLKNVELPPQETSGEKLMFDKSSRESMREVTLVTVTAGKFKSLVEQ